MGYTEVYGGPGTSRAAAEYRAPQRRSAVTSVGSDIVGSPRELVLRAQRQRAGVLSAQPDLHHGEALRIGRLPQSISGTNHSAGSSSPSTRKKERT
jgi:hypothetical protein